MIACAEKNYSFKNYIKPYYMKENSVYPKSKGLGSIGMRKQVIINITSE